MWLAGHAGFGIVVSLAAATALLLAVASARLPRGVSGGGPGAASGQDRPTGLLAGLRQAGLRRPALIFAAATVTGLSRNIAAAGCSRRR